MALVSGGTPEPEPGGKRVRQRSLRATGALAGALALLLALPLTSLGAGGLGGVVGGLTGAVPKVTGAVGSVVQHVVQPGASSTSGGSTSSTSAASGSSGSSASSAGNGAAPRAGSGSSSTPAMYGTNPHGQGSVAGVSLTPSTNVPYPYSSSGSGGEVAVVGRGRSEQGANGYHAHTTILALLGKELLGVDALPGQSSTGPLNALQTGVLDKVCQSTGMMICLTVLTADTIATSSGASTNFQLARATLGGSGHGVTVGAGQSSSEINSTGSCQTSSGSSDVASVLVAGGPAASAGQSSESSSACAGHAPSQQASSSVIRIGGTGLPLPAPGCANGTPNTILNLAGVATTVCNADNTAEAASPAGVREALTAIILPAVGNALGKIVVAAAESHAVAPASAPAPGGGGNPGGGNPGGGHHPGGKHKHSVSGTHTTQPGAGSEPESSPSTSEEVSLMKSEAAANTLPFTGQDVLKVLFLGLLLVAGGLALATRARQMS